MESQIQEPVKAKLITPEENPGVDFCVMLDCTGSMGSYITMAKNKIKDIIQQVKDLYPHSAIRIGIVGYRDFNDQPPFEILPFIEKVDEAKAFLDKLKASGGGDIPEDVNGAFQKALYGLQWVNPVRIIVHVADAPCHGKEFHSTDDHYPNGNIADFPWNQLFKDLVQKRIDYTFLKISNLTDKMFEKFKKIAIANGAEEFEINFTQELATAPNKSNKEEAFAAVISDKIKGSLEKELKKDLKRKLEKRTSENKELVAQTRAYIKDIVSKIDINSLREKYSELAAKVGECILSANNFIDALADEDCLCLTFDIGRSQAAIMDPTQIIIKSVYPSFLTAGSFFFSTEYALKKNKLAHGGYEKHAEGMILKGAASENITGVMPLYFCEENWRVAKQLMKLTIAWDVTLEPAGYQYLQMKTVPFLILAKLAQMKHEKPGSEFLNFQFDLVKQTCRQIMADGSKEEFERKFNDEVMAFYEKYVEDPSCRTVDSIASNSVFLAQIYIAMELGAKSKGEEYFDKLFLGVLEEELRRKQYSFPDDFDQNAWLFKLLNINVEEQINKPFREFIEKQKKENKGIEVSAFETSFLQVLELKEGSKVEPMSKKEDKVEKKEGIEEEKKSEDKAPTTEGKGDLKDKGFKDVEFRFKEEGAEYNETQAKAFSDYEITLKKVMAYLYPLRMLLTAKKAEDPNKFKEWGIANDFQFFALYIQNKLQSKNAYRREAISTGNYRDPWTQGEEYIKSYYSKLLEKERANCMTKYLNDMKSSKSGAKAIAFATTENLNEAAGALMGSNVGDSFIEYFKRLLEPGATKIKEKVEMLTSGHYKGVKLVLDKPGWVCGRYNANLFLRTYTNLYTADEWVKAFPRLSRTYLKQFFKEEVTA